MDYINVNVQCFQGKRDVFWGSPDFSNIISTVKAKKEKEEYYIGDFGIVAFINMRGTKSKNNENNFVDMRKKTDFKVRLAKVSEKSKISVYWDIADLEIDLSDEKIRREDYIDYVEEIRVINIKDLKISGKGEYVIKVLVKEKDAELYNLQTIHSLSIK